MKKILIYVDSMAPAGGIERVISNLSNEWVKKYEVTILVKDKGITFYNLNKNINVISLGIPFKLNMKSRISRINTLLKSIFMAHYKLKKVIKHEKPDWIYTSNPLNALEIYLLGNKFMKKMIISEHGSKLAYNRGYNFIKKKIYPKAYKISVPTTLDTELYQKDGYPAIYIPHISTFEAKCKSDLNNKVVINIGRLTADKKQITLIKIWSELNKNNLLDGWKLKIVGKGEEETNLKLFIENNNLQECVEIIPPQSDVENIYKQASIFAFTSRFEGFGMVLLEAMSFGIPCISFDCPSGPRDIIKNEVNGYLIENNNIKEYKSKLLKLINEDNIRFEMGNNAFNDIKEWNNDKILEEWYKLFERN